MPKFTVQLCRISTETGEVEVEAVDDVAAFALVEGWMKTPDQPEMANIEWELDDSTLEIEQINEDL